MNKFCLHFCTIFFSLFFHNILCYLLYFSQPSTNLLIRLFRVTVIKKKVLPTFDHSSIHFDNISFFIRKGFISFCLLYCEKVFPWNLCSNTQENEENVEWKNILFFACRKIKSNSSCAHHHHLGRYKNPSKKSLWISLEFSTFPFP